MYVHSFIQLTSAEFLPSLTSERVRNHAESGPWTRQLQQRSLHVHGSRRSTFTSCYMFFFVSPGPIPESAGNPATSRGWGNAFEVSRKRVRKVDGCSRERAQYSEPTTTTVRNLKKGKELKWTSNPALKCILNLIWSVRGSSNADLKKGNVEQIQNSLFSRQTS